MSARTDFLLFLKDNCSDDDIFEYESQMPNLKWKCQALDWSLAAASWDAHGSWEWKRLKNFNVRHRMKILFLVSLDIIYQALESGICVFSGHIDLCKQLN